MKPVWVKCPLGCGFSHKVGGKPHHRREWLEAILEALVPRPTMPPDRQLEEQ